MPKPLDPNNGIVSTNKIEKLVVWMEKRENWPLNVDLMNLFCNLALIPGLHDVHFRENVYENVKTTGKWIMNYHVNTHISQTFEAVIPCISPIALEANGWEMFGKRERQW
uniref:Uncharacterized protein n=1 Tax=Cacopsylla melanoneura TaxID=428564 RepID=A0A8D9B608_9HEMI